MPLRVLRHAGTWAMALLLLSACTVVDLDSDGKPIIPADPSAGPNYANQTPQQIATALWAPKILPAAQRQALDWAGLQQARKQIAGADTRSVFARFSGQISALDTDGLERKLTISVQGEPVTLQLGPIIKGNAVRDASGLLPFEDFKNQVQFAQISRALNKQAHSSLPSLDAGWRGKNVTVLAAFTLRAEGISDGVPLEIKPEGSQ